MTTTVGAENSRAALWMIGSMAAFAVEDAFMKRAAMILPPGMVLTVCGLIGGTVFGLLALRRGENPYSWSAFTGAPLLRNLSEAAAALFYIFALSVAPLVLVSALFQASPLAVTAGAALFLGETVGWRRWLSIGAGLIGVLIILEPWNSGFDLAGIAVLLSVIGVAARDLATRRMPVHFGSMTVSSWGFYAMVPAGLMLMYLMGDRFVLPEVTVSLQMGCAIFFGLIGYYAVVVAMRIGEVSAVAPFRYSRLVFASFIGILFLDETLGLSLIVGATIVVLSGLYVFTRERQLKAARKAASQPS